MNTCLFKKNYEPTLASLEVFRHDLQQSCKALDNNQSLLTTLQLCGTEIIANCVAYAEPTRPIAVTINREQYDYTLTVRDNGHSAPDLTSAPNLDDIDPLAEHGRGLAMLKQFCQHIELFAAAAPYQNGIHCVIQQTTPPSKLSILLVEDNLSQNRLYCEYLKSHYRVISCLSVQEAIEAIKQNAIDLVVSDISLPEQDGIDLRKQLLASSSTEFIPFIFVTGTHNIDQIKTLAHLGFDDFLEKPVDKSHLIASIERVIQRSRQLLGRAGKCLDAKVTQALYPSLPESLNDWHCAAQSRNTGSGGGDAIIVEQQNNPMIILLDVMGHDISAKFFAHAYTGYLRGLVRAQHSANSTPASILQQLSNMMLNDKLMSHALLTVLIIELLPNGQLRYASAGHPPPILITESGATIQPEGDMLAGLLADTQYQDHEMTLAHNQRLVLFSDGIFEAVDTASKRDDLQRKVMTAFTEQPASATTKQYANAVMATFDKYASTPTDDATLIVLEPITNT